MNVLARGLGGLLATLFAAGVLAQQPVKIGLILPYSGQFADTATQMDNAIKLYVKQNGETAGGRKIEIIRKDSGGIAPDVAKRLAQELVVRDRVDVITGLILTPNALAIGDVSAEAKKFTVIMNAATSIITTKSPYMARTQVTTPMLNETLGAWAAKTGGVKRAFTMVSDFGPGHDGEEGFIRAFKEAGGVIVGSVRFPVANPDFAAFVQRAKDSNPDGIFAWVPGGVQPAAIGKAMNERGIDPKKMRIMGQDALASDEALASLGDNALGIVTVAHYDHNLPNKLNRAFVSAYNADYKRNPDLFSIGGWDGMHLIYEVLKKTGGKTDGEVMIAAAKGHKWDSPRGPMMIDPETRDVIEDVYIRRVERVGGRLVNVAFDTIRNVKDPVKARMK